MDSYMILTNNPLAARKLEGRRTVCYISVPYEELLREAEKKICQGHRLLSHPLSGSVKPKETPYKSIMLSGKKEEVDRLFEFVQRRGNTDCYYVTLHDAVKI